jgi:hypothetical protein
MLAECQTVSSPRERRGEEISTASALGMRHATLSARVVECSHLSRMETLRTASSASTKPWALAVSASCPSALSSK